MPWQRVTLAQAIAQLKARFEGVPFWTDAEAISSINEALKIWNLLTGMWRRRITLQTVAAEHWYTVPGILLHNTKMNFISRPLNLGQVGDLDNFQMNWEAETTASGGDVPTTVKIWAPKALNLFAIWPADAAGGQSLVVDGIAATPVLAAPGDYMDIGDQELSALLGFALHIAAFKTGSPIFPGTFKLRQDFISAAGDQNSRLRASSYFRKIMGLDTDRWRHPLRVPDQLSPPAPATGGSFGGTVRGEQGTQ